MSFASAARRAVPGRRVFALAALLAWSATVAFAYYEVTRAESRAREAREQELHALANVVNALFLAEEGRIDGELARLRTELRAEDVWSRALENENSAEAGAAGRRLDALLRRALLGVDAFAALEIVVAGQAGLDVLGVERAEEARARRIDWAPDERAGVAKALWYADEVGRAVKSSGRRVERGDVSFEGVIELPLVRAAIGLHEPDELVQGVLVASIDLTDLAARLAEVVPAAHRLTLVSVAGRPLDPTARDATALARIAAITVRIFDETIGEGAFQVDDTLVLGRPLTREGGGVAHSLALLEARAPASGVAAWQASPWPIPLALFGVIAMVTVRIAFRSSDRDGAPSQPGGSAASAGAFGSHGLEIHPQPIVLREWLGDIRGCLEREAAKRGLAIDVRCERSLPSGLESDPGWLGGLIVAIGREALDATSADGIVVDVFEDVGDALRVEVGAGSVALAPVAGMNEVAHGVGARFESGRDGRLALVLPGAFA